MISNQFIQSWETALITGIGLGLNMFYSDQYFSKMTLVYYHFLKVWRYTWVKNSEEGGHQNPLITVYNSSSNRNNNNNNSLLSSFVFTRYSNNIYLINNIGKMITLRKKRNIKKNSPTCEYCTIT